jgi:GNAT superfamily N-acetyltransferase
MDITIKKFDHENASEEEFARLNDLNNTTRAEVLPDDPLIPLEELIASFRSRPDFELVSVSIAEDEEGKYVASAENHAWTTDNLHLMDAYIRVLPEYRRQGLATRLLPKVVETAREWDRRLVIADTNQRVPAGAALMEKLGATLGLESHTNQLVIGDLDRELVKDWQEIALERTAGFEIGLWEGAYPEEELEAIVKLHDLISQQPFGDIEIEDIIFTAETIRQDEKSMTARGYERWTYYVREKESGDLAGYTEVVWNPNRPEIIYQEMTGVFPEYRSNGLGRWLKAAMLDKVLKERPQAKYIRTGNADSNAPMLKINNELGFKPYISRMTWQIETNKLADYLDQRT